MVILAHCSPSESVFQFRQFDVTMLVFISGMSFSYSKTAIDKSNYLHYIFKRFKRLVLPVWIFLVVYFVLFGIILQKPFSLGTIMSSFCLVNGIGFIWIFRVLFSMSLINPLLQSISDHYSNLVLFIGIFSAFILNEGFNYYLIHGISNELVRDILSYIIAYTVGYGIISMMGIIWKKQKKTYKVLYFIVFLCLYLFWGSFLLNNFPSLQLYKYPPTVYYISYGMLFSIVLYELCSNVKHVSRFITWVSKETFMIYLMQILVLSSDTFIPFSGILHNWFSQWVYVIIMSIMLTFLWEYLIKTVKRIIR